MDNKEKSNSIMINSLTENSFKKNSVIIRSRVRTNSLYMEDIFIINRIVTNKITNYRGIKGPCELAKLKYFKPVESTAIDYMHSVLYGVVQKLMEVWFSNKYSSHPSSLFDHLQEIDK